MYGCRTNQEYLDGVTTFLTTAEEDRLKKGVEFIYCPCCDCRNERFFPGQNSSLQIQAHLIIRGYKPNYTCWTKHGEEQNVLHEDVGIVEEPDVNEMSEDDEEVGADDDCGGADDDDRLDQMLRDADVNFSNEGEFNKFMCLIEDSEKPLFLGCKPKYTKLSSVLELLKLKASYGWSDKSFTALLGLVSDMLPDGNELPKNTYQAKQVLCPLEMEVQRIHACPNDCILYRKDLSNLHSCPVCKASRYKRKSESDAGEVNKGIPAKVVWYLPVIPRLKRLFANPREAKLLRWHSDDRMKDGKLRHPADSAQWRNIDRIFEEFGAEPRNIRFALSTDGMNPFGNMSSRHSTWPVVLSIYNLPPWLCMKRKYIMMSLLIQGPKQPGNDIDVYLRPLVEDLKTLWNEGAQVWDAYKRENFTLRAMLFCTINDLPALRNLSGQSKAADTACPQFLDGTASVWLAHSRKTVFMRHRRFLSRNHPYRNIKEQFDGTRERGLCPRHYSGQDVYNMIKDIDVVLGKGRKKLKAGGMWKKRSIFWELPYWRHLEVRHCIDVMHVEKNVCDSLIGLLLNIPGKTKDGLNARLDLVDMKIRPELAPEPSEKGRTRLPPACYNLKKTERTELCRCLHGVKVPSGYSANISKLVSMEDLKLVGMKSHDCHVLMTQMLPVAIRNIQPSYLRDTIIRLCYFFNTISQKVIDLEALDILQADVVKTLCHLEMYFPPSFFDIMVHFIVHLVREIKICGPVFLRWMYPFERYMGILKHYVRNRSRSEGSIVEGYTTEEVVEFCIDYMEQLKPIGVPMSRHEGRLDGKGTIGRKLLIADYAALSQAHFTVLQHMTEISPYIAMHKDDLRRENPGRTEAWITKRHNCSFNHWLEVRTGNRSTDDNIGWLARWPSHTIVQFEAYDINGYTFYTRAQDRKSTVQNSGVRIDAFQDKRGVSAFYGYIEEIWELDYVRFKIPLFRCRWVALSSVKVDKHGMTTLDLERAAYKDEPFVLAKQVAQVFYVQDPANEKLHVVLQGKRSIVGVDNVVDEDEYNKFDELPLGDGTALNDEQLPTGAACYLRVDHQEGLLVKLADGQAV
jgi:hypothetical protein